MRKRIQPGDLIAIDGSVGHNHGCRDYAIVRYVDGGRGEVIEASSCTSCWQVGHDADHVFAREGDTWSFADEYLTPAGDDWSADVTWEAHRLPSRVMMPAAYRERISEAAEKGWPYWIPVT